MGLLNQLSKQDKKSPIDQTKQFYSENKKLVRSSKVNYSPGQWCRMGSCADDSAERSCSLSSRVGASSIQLSRIRS